MKICVLLFLGFNAVKDVRDREVSLFLTVLMAVLGLGSWIWKREDWTGTLMILAINFFLIAFSILTHGAVGLGDALVLAAIGTVLSLEEYSLMICIGLALASAFSLFLLFFRKKRKEEEIPLIPFFLLGYIGGLLI